MSIEPKRLDWETFGRRTRDYRKDCGLSQEEFAEVIDLTPRMISYIETGSRTPSLEVVFRIANFFGISIESLFEPYDMEIKEEVSAYGDAERKNSIRRIDAKMAQMTESELTDMETIFEIYWNARRGK